ncbi:hypothetical protein HNR46_002701 [Haloferula luteola]|uniref:Uncharacterized protein n=1 Tax=Haloferula luteola TaxID=595692 RepID=A0A840V380_9BACT|nr:hypothetical protein [Haloferula luteola]MBB5352455.1 hypothetical protein [Haloferula luteola]
MTIQLHPSSANECSTLTDVLSALRKEGLRPSHEAKNWGDWIHFEGSPAVISIESLRGLTSSATLEWEDEDDVDLTPIYRAFDSLGWVGCDEEGEFPLV